MSDRPTAILLTPPGPAAIAVVRLVGPGVGAFLSKLFSKKPAEGRCVHGTLADGARAIDDPVVVLHAGGGVADVNLHGGAWVVRSVLELARREGFDVVDRPEMPLPEEVVDGPTPLAREVQQYLPMARTELALRVLLAQEEAWDRYRRSHVGSASADPLLNEQSRAAGAHDPKNNRSAEADPTAEPTAEPEARKVERILADRSLYWLLHPPRVAIVGVPNVGKSTLANQLFAQERSITADLPGTTRDWVGEIANVDGLAVVLVDTPGVRETSDEIEREAIGRARDQVATADLVVVVMDQSQAGTLGEQVRLLESHSGALPVVNKADQPKWWGVFTDPLWVHTVATTGEGVDRLRREIKQFFLGPEPFDVNRARWWTRRQREILVRALVDPGGLPVIS